MKRLKCIDWVPVIQSQGYFFVENSISSRSVLDSERFDSIRRYHEGERNPCMSSVFLCEIAVSAMKFLAAVEAVEHREI